MSIHLQKAYRGGYSGRPGWWLHFAYSEASIDAIKCIAASERSWDEEKKRWWVSLEAEDKLLKLAPSLEAYKRQGVLSL